VGDNLESDIAGAKKLGMTTVLTLTGVTAQSELERLPPTQKPNFVIENLNALSA